MANDFSTVLYGPVMRQATMFFLTVTVFFVLYDMMEQGPKCVTVMLTHFRYKCNLHPFVIACSMDTFWHGF